MSHGSRFESLARENILRISPYQAGKPVEEVERELGIHSAFKLASNENCLGSSPRALEAGREALGRGVHLYPDADSFYLRRRLAELHGVAPEQIFVGCGSTEIIQLLAQAYCGPGRSALLSAASFVMYPIAVLASGGEGIVRPLGPGERYDLPAMAAAARADSRLAFVANPNNPTGTWVGRAEVRAFLDALPEHVIAVLDEAYKEYVEEPDYPDGIEELKAGRTVVVLRTFSKIHGLAGMRIGYAVGPAGVFDPLHRLRSPFNLTSLGQAMALAALDDHDHIKRSCEHNRRELAFLGAELAARRVPFTPSVANFLLVDVGRDASGVYQAMLRKGVITRPMGGFPTRLRVSVGTREANQAFLVALDAACR